MVLIFPTGGAEIQKRTRVNHQIRVPELRVIGPNAEQLGVVTLQQALDLASEHGLDLVEVAPTAKPPVARIMDYSKFKYDQEKKERRVKKSSKVTHLKQIRMRPHIDENDYQIKLKQAITFLSKKDKVRAVLMFRGREIAFKNQGQEILKRFAEDTVEYGQVEKDISLEGKNMSIVISPKSVKA